MERLYGKARAHTRQFCVSTIRCSACPIRECGCHIFGRSGFVPSQGQHSLAPFRPQSATSFTWQSVCSRTRPYAEEHSCCQSKTRTAARWTAPRGTNARLSGIDRSSSAGNARHVHGVVYAPPCAAMADAAASDRVFRPESTGTRAEAHRATKEGRLATAARGMRSVPRMSNDHLLSRRAFTVESVLAILATATITITGCDGGSDLGPSPPAGAR